MKTMWAACLLFSFGFCQSAWADLFFVETEEGPGFASPREAAEVLEQGILPLFDQMIELQKRKKIVAGGLPAGSRTFYLIVEAESNDEVDRMLRDLGAWGVFTWKVTPLQTLRGRADMERDILKALKSTM